MGRETNMRSASPTPGVSPSNKMRPLQRLIGTWITSGTMLKGDEQTADAFTFVDQYAWLPGGHFIAHSVTGELGTTPLQGLEIIGYDGAALRATSYDSAGVVTKYRARLQQRAWSLTGDKERFRGTFSVDGKRLEGTWERRARGVWKGFMRVTLTRVGD